MTKNFFKIFVALLRLDSNTWHPIKLLLTCAKAWSGRCTTSTMGTQAPQQNKNLIILLHKHTTHIEDISSENGYILCENKWNKFQPLNYIGRLRLEPKI